MYKIKRISQNSSDYGGINFDNEQIQFGSIDMYTQEGMEWQKKNGVFIDPTKKFKDLDSKDAYEVDLSKKVNCVGMPDESIFGNSSTDCYGG